MADYGGECCPSCCRAADHGVHDYCLPCETNPSCPRAAKEYAWKADTQVQPKRAAKDSKASDAKGKESVKAGDKNKKKPKGGVPK